jgi:hypothetical protein
MATTVEIIRHDEKGDQPLSLLREFLESKKHHAPEKRQRDEAWTLLMLLDSFENEVGIRSYVQEKMTYCELHGLIGKGHGHDCFDFDTWLDTFAWQDCGICKFERVLSPEER